MLLPLWVIAVLCAVAASGKSIVWYQGFPQIRTQISLPGASGTTVKLRISALGCGVPHWNGQSLSNEILGPPWSRYQYRVLFKTFDIFVGSDLNVLAVQMGSCHYSSNWYNGTFQGAIWAELLMENGTEISVGNWRGTEGPFVSSTIYGGEVYNLDAETPGWKLPGYNDTDWNDSLVLGPDKAPAGQLEPMNFEGQSVLKVLPPVSQHETEEGVIFDFGVNFAGFAEVLLPETAPFSISMHWAELLWPNGTLNPSTNGLAENRDRVFAQSRNPGPSRWWNPLFTLHGGRFVLVKSNVPVKQIRGLMVANRVSKIASFHSNITMLNSIMAACEQSQLSNLHGIPTDCPQRDERLGWLADAQVNAMLPFANTSAMFASFLREIQVSQRESPSGALIDFVPDCDPEDGNFTSICNRSYARPADPSWAAAYPKIMWFLRDYGTVLEQHWESLLDFVQQLQSMADSNGLLTWGKLGDWYATARCDHQIVSGYQQYSILRIVEKIAQRLGRANPFDGEAEKVAFLFAEAYIRHDGSMVTQDGEMCAQAIALEAGLVPESLRAAVQARLVENVRLGNMSPNGTRIFPGRSVCGVIGTAHIFSALCNSGECQLALDAIVTPEYPSFGFMIANGATTLWETWTNACSDPNTPCDSEDSSRNHVMFASVANFVFEHLGGLSRVNASTVAVKRPRNNNLHLKATSSLLMPDAGSVSLSVDSSEVILRIPDGVSACIDETKMVYGPGEFRFPKLSN